MTLTELSKKDLEGDKHRRNLGLIDVYIIERAERSIQLCEDELEFLSGIPLMSQLEPEAYESIKERIADIKTALINWRKIVE